MTIAVSVLGSGSGGNCSVLRLGRERDRCVMVDAGLSIRRTTRHLRERGVAVPNVTDILVTHFDHDHWYRGWARTVTREKINVHVHERHAAAARRRGVPGHRLHVYTDAFDLAPSVAIHPCLCHHDTTGSVAFVVESSGVRLGWATDLGRVADRLLDTFVNLHALAIESNYDRDLQMASSRPGFLKGRIMGGAGHLSNDETIRAVRQVEQRSALSQLVLLHLSRECNDPGLVQRLYARLAPHLLPRLTISSQYQPTPWLDVDVDAPTPPREPMVGEQMMLF